MIYKKSAKLYKFPKEFYEIKNLDNSFFNIILYSHSINKYEILNYE